MQAKGGSAIAFDAEKWVQRAESLGCAIAVLIDRETLRPGQIRLALPEERPVPQTGEVDPFQQIFADPGGPATQGDIDRLWSQIRDYLLATGRYTLASAEEPDSDL